MKRLIRMPAKAIAGLALPMITLWAAGPTQAQDDRWFKVELLVFSQVSASAATSETWDPAPELSYPNEFRFLTEPLAIETNLACYNATGVMDEFGRQILTINPPASDDEPAKQEPPPAEPIDETRSAMAVSPEPLPLTPTPFIKLAGSEMEFRGKAAYMRRTGRYQILFHESWVQPVESEADTLPIILDQSGDTRGWPDLQGSIKLYVSRYLHIETNLWLNTMGQYLPQYWQIPAAPLGPQSLIVVGEPLFETGAAVALQDLPKTVEIHGENTVDVPDPIVMAPVYPWHHAVVLQQKRRMRSTEVHYIDHPMLGVVVLVSPLTDEELEEMAAVEFAPESEDVIAE